MTDENKVSFVIPEVQRVQVDDLDTMFENITSEIKKLGGVFQESQKEKKVSIDVDVRKDTEKYIKAIEAIRDTIAQSFPEYPKSISLDEAGDIVDVLKKILSEAKKDKLGNFNEVLKKLDSIQKTIPITELPIENGRVKVILPDDQVLPMRTDLGKKVKQTTGQFVGGITVNPNLSLKDNVGNIVNPATKDKQIELIDDIDSIFFPTIGTDNVKKYYTNAGAVNDGIVWSPAAGKRFYITDIFVQVSADCTVTLEDDLAAGDDPIWKAELAANSGWSHSFRTPLFSGEDAADLIVTTTAGNVYITVTGYEK